MTKRDLLSVDGCVAFSETANLEFADDVDWDTFNERVASIENTVNVAIPKSLTQFQVLTRCREVGRVVQRR